MIGSIWATVRGTWRRLREHILFIPAMLVLLAVILAVVTVEVDRRIDEETIRGIPWLFRAGASGARDVLTTVATAMIQLAAITFSVTIVALALRSQQFGPRLLRNFTGDRVNQGILGAFVSTFVYALLVLRAVRDVEDVDGLDAETFIPLVSVSMSIVLAVASLGLFVVFIDRIVTAIQANSIIAEVAKETHRAVDRLFPDRMGDAPDAEDEPDVEIELDDPCSVVARRTGYIQKVDGDDLLQLVTERDLVVRMEAPVGGFVIAGTPVATVSPKSRTDDEVLRHIEKLYTIGRDRTVDDDPEFGVRQIVDVAVKALSPSDNDPTTACTATEYLGAVLVDFATRAVPGRLRLDPLGKVRVVTLATNFERMTDLALDQIREHGGDDAAAVLQLLETIGRVAEAVRLGPRRAVLESHVRKVARAADRGIPDADDRRAVNRRIGEAMRRLGREERDILHHLIPLNGGAGGE
jgi:uncharacterized membrane protein